MWKGLLLLLHLFKLLPSRHLLSKERCLDAVKETLEPTNQLCLGDPQLGVRRYLVLAERQCERVQLVGEVGRQRATELGD